jgi:hypothetical protein
MGGHGNCVQLLVGDDTVDVNQVELGLGRGLVDWEAGHHRAEVDGRACMLGQLDGKQRTPLMLAAAHGSEEVVARLLEAGEKRADGVAIGSATNLEGCAPEICCCAWSPVCACGVCGVACAEAETDFHDADGATVLHYALQPGVAAGVAAKVLAGVKVEILNDKDGQGQTCVGPP